MSNLGGKVSEQHPNPTDLLGVVLFCLRGSVGRKISYYTVHNVGYFL